MRPRITKRIHDDLILNPYGLVKRRNRRFTGFSRTLGFTTFFERFCPSLFDESANFKQMTAEIRDIRRKIEARLDLLDRRIKLTSRTLQVRKSRVCVRKNLAHFDERTFSTRPRASRERFQCGNR
jgi:hypothetical protein